MEDAHGEPPTIPFWLGEAPARTVELSSEVSALREEVGRRLDPPDEAVKWLMQECGLTDVQAAEIVEYLGAARNATNNGMGLARGYLDTDTATNEMPARQADTARLA